MVQSPAAVTSLNWCKHRALNDLGTMDVWWQSGLLQAWCKHGALNELGMLDVWWHSFS